MGTLTMAQRVSAARVFFVNKKRFRRIERDSNTADHYIQSFL